MNFSYNITVNGRKITREEFNKTAELVFGEDAELVKKIGALPSPYLQYFFHRNKKVEQLRSSATTRGEDVLALEAEIFSEFADIKNSKKPPALGKRGGGGYSEVASCVMSAIYNNEDTLAYVNVPNHGVLKFLPYDAVIETNCLVNAAGINPVVISEPPEAVWGLISAVKNYEQLTVKAAVTGCRDTALLALIAHPLIGDYDVASALLPKLLEANKEYLHQFFN